MRPFSLAPAILLALPLWTGACNPATPPASVLDQNTGEYSRNAQGDNAEPIGVPSNRATGEYLTSGLLKKVGLDDKTLTISISGRDYPFEFGDDTEVRGGQRNEIQGLVGKNGSPIAIYYRQEGSMRQAVRIDLQ